MSLTSEIANKEENAEDAEVRGGVPGMFRL